eukprot:1159332-Pelagomonas_calceolata.AAC.8
MSFLACACVRASKLLVCVQRVMCSCLLNTLADTGVDAEALETNACLARCKQQNCHARIPTEIVHLL